MQLRHLKDRYPAELSGGQQQRVALARAIVIEPEVLLLDEPLSNLDANLREEMRSEIRRLHDAFQITTVYVTHDQAEAMVTCDRIVVMNHGRIEQVDDPVIDVSPAEDALRGRLHRPHQFPGRHGCDGDRIVFPGFNVPAGLAPDCRDVAARGQFFGSAADHRPPSLGARLDRARTGGWTERSRNAPTWASIGNMSCGCRRRDLRLRVSTPPTMMHDIDQSVWMEIDPARAARIPGPEGDPTDERSSLRPVEHPHMLARNRRPDRLDDLQQAGPPQRRVAGHVGGDARDPSTISRQDPAVRVIVLKGAGEQAFVSGADISQFEKARSSAESNAHYDRISERGQPPADRRARKPTIAMIRGFCIGGGLAIAVGCDIRIATEGCPVRHSGRPARGWAMARPG